jgi:hypothetical protein
MSAPVKQEIFVGTDECRLDRRFKIALPVMLNTLTSDQNGWIVDVSRKGIKVCGIKVPPRSRVCVHYKRQFAEGTVRWVRANGNVGIVLDQPLQTGPLAAVWKRFHENVEAFGKHKRLPKPLFGRKSAK